MTGVATEECEAGRSSGGISSPTGEESAELRSLGQVENGIPSTSPPYWDSDKEDGGPKPSDLYGKYTWKIDKFSQINKRELRSSVFEIGGYKWYILIYPQGCDVCNHISLFLCVANHDKLLPGWSHFAQFTIAVVNKDSKKSKYSDTLHRFWKKEHDWGWKKFMELSKVFDGFIDDDTLTIKAQVQVIRERQDRPFRCLDFQYRRELVRVYLTNVDQICRRNVEDWRCKLRKLIEDNARWSSFCAFWLGMDQNLRRHMSREKAECILKLVVKKFFIDKEVTSTLVMDSVYSGLKALEGQEKGKKCKGKYPYMEQLPNPLIRIEIDTFVLVDDLLLLIERAAMEPLPPKDEKGPQDRMKDGAAGEESSKDSIERDERQLTELGCRTVEIYALYHIYSKIEVAYQEAVALKRQEELIREEEAACFAEIDQKARRGLSDKEKKSKKKQAKQKKNKIKVKDKGRDEKHCSIEHKIEQDSSTAEREDFAAVETKMVLEPPDSLEDVSDVSDSVDCEVSEGRGENSVNWDTDTCERCPSSGITAVSSLVNGKEGRNTSTVDDSSSTCSSDSVPLVVVNVPNRGGSASQKSSSRGRNNQSTANRVREEIIQPSEAVAVQSSDASQSPKIIKSLSRLDLQDKMVSGSARHLRKKVEEAGSSRQRNLSPKGDVYVDLYRDKSTCISPPKSPWKNIPSIKSDPPVKVNKSSSSDSTKHGGRLVSVQNSASMQTDNSHKISTATPSIQPQMNITSRPSSAPLVVPMVQVGPALARSASAAGRLGPVPESTSYAPPQQSYRNAIMGSHVNHHSLNVAYSSQAPTSTLVSAPLFSHPAPIQPSFSFGMVNQLHETLQNGHIWMEQQRNSRNFLDDMQQRHDLYTNGDNPVHSSRLQSQAHVSSAGPTDEFPHLDIINDLLDDDIINDHRNFSNGPQHWAQAYHDGFQQHEYVSVNPSGVPYDAAVGPYMNGQSDVFVPNQWQMSASETSFFGLGNATTDNVDGYRYHQQPLIPEFPNLTVGFNAYTVFRPNGL